MQYTVNRGDSLWRLAVQYQGSGTQWPKIVEHHNTEVARYGPNSGLLTIEDPNLIFIGQTLFLPPRPKRIELGEGNEFSANQPAKGLDLKFDYGIGRDTPPCVWSKHFPELDIKVELSGDIAIEMLSDSRHRHNLAIALSRDSVEVKQKLKELYDPVISKLLAEPSVKFEGGKVKLNCPIAAQANLGPYTIEVHPGVTPMQMSGSIKPPTINATVKNDGYDFKYSADIAFKVDVVMRPRNQPVPEPVAERAPQKQKEFLEQTVPDTDWEQLVAKEGPIVAFILVLVAGAYWIARGGVPVPNFSSQTTGMPPFTHTIGHHNQYPPNA